MHSLELKTNQMHFILLFVFLLYINSNLTIYSESNIMAGTVLDVVAGDMYVIGFTETSPFNWRLKYHIDDSNKSQYKNLPSEYSTSGIYVGFREVYYTSGTDASNANVLVKLTEEFPIPGRTFYSFLNYGSWSGWKVSTPV